MDNEIEMNDLLGHTEDILSSTEKGAQHDGKADHSNKPAHRLTSRMRMNRYHILVILVVLIGTVAFVVDRIYMPREEMDALLEADEEMQKAKEEDKTENKIEGSQFGGQDNPEISNGDNAIGNNPSKQEGDHGCDRNPKNCDDSTDTDNTIDDVVEEKQEPKPSNDEKSEYPATIFDGVDDKDVYCEDLSQYQKWHETKITKNDGKMYRIVKQMNHDKTSFTQGLTYARGKLFESAGLYGKSTVRILDRDSAHVTKKVPIENRLFAEGLAYYKDTLVQITWKSHRGFIYNITNLEEIDNFTFSTTLNEGWGITWDRCKDELIVTDGSENLHFWDPNTMNETRRVSVRRMDGSKALEMNEIEFWRGRVLANIWFEDVILVINPETGIVEKEYDFSQLWPKLERTRNRADVLNGISISKDPDILYFTGKLWDRMYGIQLLPKL